MSELVKYQNSEIQQFRQRVLRNTEGVMTKVEAKVMQASLAGESKSSHQMKDLEHGELGQLVAKNVPYIVKDLGITQWKNEEKQYELIRFTSVLKDYYGDLTFAEVRLAFELLLTGQLDDHLPKSRGQADRGHYQNFSLEFVNKVLLAFRLQRNKVWGKAMQEDRTEKQTTEEEKRAATEQMRLYILKVFDQMKKTGEYEGFTVTIPVYMFLQQARVLGNMEVTELDRKMALVETRAKTGAYGRAHVKEEDGEVQTRAKIRAMDREIKEKFEELIKEGKELDVII
jgi:hypothetical protein